MSPGKQAVAAAVILDAALLLILHSDFDLVSGLTCVGRRAVIVFVSAGLLQ